MQPGENQPHLVLMSRPFPLPALTAGGRPITFLHWQPGTTPPPGPEAFITAAIDPVPAALIAQFPKSLGLIANLGVGTDNIDRNAARARGLLVSNTPVVTEDTADLCLALMLAACRRVGQNERFLRQNLWSAHRPNAVLGTSLGGKTLGIIGFGAIGQAVARRAAGFDMLPVYTGPSRKQNSESRSGAEFEPNLDTLLARADIVTLHCPLTQATQHLLNAARLAKLKPGAVIINTGRGALIDEQALVAALQSGQVGAAGLDVFENEPSVSPELLAMEQVVLTPHIGSATAECRAAVVRRGLANLVNFLETGSVIDPVR